MTYAWEKLRTHLVTRAQIWLRTHATLSGQLPFSLDYFTQRGNLHTLCSVADEKQSMHAHIWLQTHTALIIHATQSRQDSVKNVQKKVLCVELCHFSRCVLLQHGNLVLLQMKTKNDTRTHPITHAHI